MEAVKLVVELVHLQETETLSPDMRERTATVWLRTGWSFCVMTLSWILTWTLGKWSHILIFLCIC